MVSRHRNRIEASTLTVILEVQRLSKFYTTHSIMTYVIKDINLTVSRGKFIVVMGKSGSGKTTLLQLIGALIEPSEGEIRVDGQSLQEISVEPHATQYRREKVGFIFQFFNLVASVNAEDNVAMPLLLAGVNKKEAYDKARDLLEKVGLLNKRKQYPHTLSGGEQQRVAIARALVPNPCLLLADEPTGNLDSVTTSHILSLLVQLQKQRNQTILLVTHDPQVAAHADRVIFLHDGKLILDHANDKECGHSERVSIIVDLQLASQGKVDS